MSFGLAPTYSVAPYAGYPAPYHGSAFSAPIYNSGYFGAQYPSIAQYPTIAQYSPYTYGSPYFNNSYNGWYGAAPSFAAAQTIAPTVTHAGATVSGLGAPRAPRRAPPVEPPPGYE